MGKTPVMCRNLNILKTSRTENSSEMEPDSRSLAWLFLALRGLLGIQSDTASEELHYSQFGGAAVVN